MYCLKIYQLSKTAKSLGDKCADYNKPYAQFSVKFQVLKTALHKKYLVYRAQISRESLLHYLLILTIDFFVARLENRLLI